MRFLLCSCRAAAIVLAVISTSGASAQNQTDLPPVAAPTSRIEVGAIPVVRSASQQADDFVSGLLKGLGADPRIEGVAIAAVEREHIVVQRESGSLKLSTRFPAPALVHALSGVPRDETMATTSVADLLRLATAAISNPMATQEFAEMQRNSRRALQLDSSAQTYSARLVIAPEAKLAYVIAMEGRPDARVWRIVDDAIFDELLPRDDAAASGVTGSANADAVSPGIYEPDRSRVFLKIPEAPLQVRTGAGRSFRLSGAENATLAPQRGLWSTPDGKLTAIFEDGKLLLSSGASYRLVPLYQRPALYLLLLLAVALCGFGVMLRRAV